jgi:hypothetical protein
MFEKESFYRQIDLNLTVAMLGISRNDWFCHKQGMSRDDVKNEMILKGYDVVPILNKKKQITGYFSSEKEFKPRVNSISANDKIYYLTDIRDAIWKMNKENRTHYFLSNGRDENDIVGLISLSNFNNRDFYVYIFNLLSYIEREFAKLINMDTESAFKAIEHECINEELKSQFLSVRNRFEDDKKKNIENDFKEYLYLNHLLWLIKAEKIHLKLGYNDKGSDFMDGTGKLRDIRNVIAHPVKSLVQTIDNLKELEVGLNKLFEYKDNLENYLKRAER